jgi:hypothetical protein
MCQIASVAIWLLPQTGLSVEEPVLQGCFWWLLPSLPSPIDILWSTLVPQELAVTTHGDTWGWKTYIRMGAAWCPRGTTATLYSQCHAAFRMMPHILALVDQSPVHFSMMRTSRVGFWRGSFNLKVCCFRIEGWILELYTFIGMTCLNPLKPKLI